MEQFANDAKSTLAASVGTEDAALIVADPSPFPPKGDFRLRIDDELLLVTTVEGNTFNVDRGAEDTTAVAHAKGTEVLHVLTAAALDQLAAESADGLAQEVEDREAADVAEAKARAEVDSAESAARESHESDTTSVHGIADTSKLAVDADIAAEAEAREVADESLAAAASVAQAVADAALPKAGGTMTGLLTLAEDPKSPLDAATRQYVLAQYAALVNGAPEALDTLKELGDALKAAEESEDSALEALTALVETKLSKAANLSDLADAAEARTHLGLGSAATKAAGAAGEAGKVLNADDVTEKTRAEAAEGVVKDEVKTEKERAEAAEALKLVKSENLKDLGSASTARTNLELGTAATKDAGAAGVAGKVLNADDPTTSDARVPKAHAASHKTAGSDPLAASDIGAAAASHTHAQSDVTGLVEALAGKQAALGYTPENVANKDTDTALAANSDTKYPSQKAVKSYIDGLLAASDAVIYKGALDCSGNPKYPAASAGHLYRVSVAGKIGGGSGINVEVGDTLLCNTDGSAEGSQAEVGSKWNVIQANIDGAVVGPASAGSGNIPTFEGTTGKIVKDSGVAISTDGTLGANSDAKTPTEKATKTYADTKAAASAVSNVDNTSDATKNSATATLTNKRITARVTSIESSAEPEIKTDEVDQFNIKALAVAVTSMTTKLKGTPTDGQKLIIRILDNGTARAITWGASFASRGATLPTTTVLSKYLYVGLIYNSTKSVWDCVATSQEV